MKKQSSPYAVLTADIAGSREIDDFPSERDKRLRPVTRLHRTSGLIASDYAITAWDEFEGLLTALEHIPQVLLDLRRLFHPLQLRVAIGIGDVSNPTRKPVNVFAGGSAFERARKAITQLNAERMTLARSTLFLSDSSEFDTIMNALYQLHDTLVQRISTKQWEAINLQLKAKSQDATAQRLRLDKSSISRRLRRGYYWQLVNTREAAKAIIAQNWKQR